MSEFTERGIHIFGRQLETPHSEGDSDSRALGLGVEGGWAPIACGVE